jgi:hypothetical protein
MAKKKNKIPKKIAGVKIPKVFRKNTLLKGLLGSPTGRKVMAEAVMAAATAAAGVLMAAKPKAAAKAGQGLVEAVSHDGDILKDALKSAAGAMTDVITKAARSALPLPEDEVRQPRGERTH